MRDTSSVGLTLTVKIKTQRTVSRSKMISALNVPILVTKLDFDRFLH